jgi:hypothetical protein
MKVSSGDQVFSGARELRRRALTCGYTIFGRRALRWRHEAIRSHAA